jgi:phosphatidylinositol-4,5-bisphosphate 4-phosphatase
MSLVASQHAVPADSLGGLRSAAVQGLEENLRERAKRLSLSQPWNPIERNLPHAGSMLMVPANEHFSRLVGGEAFVGYGSTGVASEALKTELSHFPARAPNLWHTTFTAPGNEIILDYLRSGTSARYGERDEGVRTAANLAAAREIVEAARIAVERRGSRGDFSLLSIDLQTPNGTGPELDIEQETVRESRAALRAEADERMIVNGEIGHVRLTSIVLPTHEGSYRRADEWRLSAETITVAKQIASRPLYAVPDNLRPAVAEVVREIDILLAHEETDSASPAARFGLGARLVLVASLTGDVVHFNCRSGKDRTGFLDAEVKFLAYQLSRRLQGLPVSAPGARVLADEAAAWKEILLQGGNIEIQVLNTGYPGSKVDHGTLLDRVGPELWTEFTGQGRNARI